MFLKFKTLQSGSAAWALPRLFFILLVSLPQALTAGVPELQKAPGPGRFNELLSQKPFWRKPQFWKALESERKIVVSSTHSQIWNFKGAGLVDAPWEFCFLRAREFERLKDISEHFTDIHFNPATSTLHLRLHFLGRQWPLSLLLNQEKIPSGARLYFKSIGPWLGTLEGVFEFKEHQRQFTEVSFFGFDSAEFDWIPNFVFKVASEGVMHHVAEQLRKSIEADYKKK